MSQQNSERSLRSRGVTTATVKDYRPMTEPASRHGVTGSTGVWAELRDIYDFVSSLGFCFFPLLLASGAPRGSLIIPVCFYRLLFEPPCSIEWSQVTADRTNPHKGPSVLETLGLSLIGTWLWERGGCCRGLDQWFSWLTLDGTLWTPKQTLPSYPGGSGWRGGGGSPERFVSAKGFLVLHRWLGMFPC